MMNDDTLVSRIGTLIETVVDGDIVAIDVDHGMCYGMNATATRIWQLIHDPVTVGELTRTLGGEFDVPQAECRRDVEALLSDMADQKMVRLDG